MTASINASTSSGVVITSDTSGNLDIQSGGTTKFSVTSSGVSYTPAGSAITSGTAQTTTSGTSFDFTSIPSWVKRITLVLNGVSLSGTSNFLVQLGTSSGVETTGYVSTSVTSDSAGGTAGINSTSGYCFYDGSAAYTCNSIWIFANVSGNLWVSSHSGSISTTNVTVGGGTKTLAGTLDRLRMTTVNGTDTFDAGSINIQYE